MLRLPRRERGRVERKQDPVSRLSVFVLALGIVLGAVACTDHGRMPDAPEPRRPAADALSIVSSGFTIVDDGDWLSAAVQINNPTLFAALDTQVTASLIDEQGEVVAESAIEFTITALRSNGQTAYATELSAAELDVDLDAVADIEVDRIDTSSWKTDSELDHPIAAISYSEITYAKSMQRLELSFEATNQKPQVMPSVRFTAVFLDETGKTVLGGCSESWPMSGETQDVSIMCRVPDSADQDKTRVYTDPS